MAPHARNRSFEVGRRWTGAAEPEPLWSSGHIESPLTRRESRDPSALLRSPARLRASCPHVPRAFQPLR
jgi:hypothetical protein